MTSTSWNRRRFLTATAACVSGTSLRGEESLEVIDLHQHTAYHGREDAHLIAHQKAMGVSRTILLPAGTPMSRPSTHEGKSNGLAAQCGTTEDSWRLAQEHPDLFLWGANEVTDLDEAPTVLEGWLKKGACIIGEQKFDVACDSEASQKLYALAGDYGVPILLHFQFEKYNRGFERFHTMLEKYPRTNFIGHAQTMWGNIDREHVQKDLYPKGSVTPGGLTDRYLADYPNFFGDMSAGSGLNALTRDEDHARAFMKRHQDKLIYGSDCKDHLGRGPGCQGASTIAAIRRLAEAPVAAKLLSGNARRLFAL